MTERMVCVDIYLKDKDLGKAETIRYRVARRTPKKGSVYYRDENRWSNLKGREETVLRRIAEQKVQGLIYGVDGIFEGGINIAAKVSHEEAQRIRQDQSYFISAEQELSEDIS